MWLPTTPWNLDIVLKLNFFLDLQFWNWQSIFPVKVLLRVSSYCE